MCLRIGQSGLHVICDRNLAALHVRGYTRFTHRGGGASERFGSNNKILWGKLGPQMRRNFLKGLVARDGIYAPPSIRIAFAVTEAGADAVAGDYFTALELARSLTGHAGVEVVFLSEKEDWYDGSNIDVIIAMRHDYDTNRVLNRKPHCITVAWPRNHFETWLRQPWLASVDLVISSSKLFSFLLKRRHGVVAHEFLIATAFRGPRSPSTYERNKVVFIGSRWGGARDIEVALQPESIDGELSIYGEGFGEVEALRPYWRGVLPYSKVEDVYHRSAVVIDDANSTTKRWGSPNSRVFDAIAAGALVISNSKATSKVLGGVVPVWRDAGELTSLLNSFNSDPTGLRDAVERQFAAVDQRHRYSHRADKFLDIISGFAAHSLRIEVLTAVPPEVNPVVWGDWHFALSLARALRESGHAVRVRKLGEKLTGSADVVIGLRGLQRFTPVLGAINLLWIISHPDLVAADELNGWQHIFTASATLARRLSSYASSISVLEQATDFSPASLWGALKAATEATPSTGVFVGNSRGVTRPFIDLGGQGRRAI